MKALQQLLRSGGVLRMRPPYGPYVVLGGKSTPVAEAVVRQAVKAGVVRPNGVDQHGVYLFAMCQARSGQSVSPVAIAKN